MTNQDLVAEVRKRHERESAVGEQDWCDICYDAHLHSTRWPCDAIRLADEVERLTKLIEAKDEYMALLRDDFYETALIAGADGWRSSRMEASEKARAKIAALTHD